jgi:hypothetical protein
MRWSIACLLVAGFAAGCGRESSAPIAPLPAASHAKPLTNDDVLAVPVSAMLSNARSQQPTFDVAGGAATAPTPAAEPVAVAVALVAQLPTPNGTAAVVRRVTQWPHDVILMTPSGASAGTLALAIQRLGVEHHKHGDIPDHDYVMLVVGSTLPLHWKGKAPEAIAQQDFKALKVASVKNVAGVGDVPAIVIHMAPIHR